MKKLSFVICLVLLCTFCLPSAYATSPEINNVKSEEIAKLQDLLKNDCVEVKNLELVSSNMVTEESVSYSTDMLVAIRTYESVYRYIDVGKSTITLNEAPIYSYINNYTVEVYLYDKKSGEEFARGFVSANFRYNKEYREAKCLSTDAGTISSLKGYTVETTHRVENVTWDVGGAYGEVDFKWGFLNLLKNNNTVTITCDWEGNVKYTCESK